MYVWETGNTGIGGPKHPHRWGPPERPVKKQLPTRFCTVKGCHAWQTKKRISRREYLAHKRAQEQPVIPLSELKLGQVYRDGQGRLIYLESGAYVIENRVSNHWTWRLVRKDGSLGKREFGYGGQWRAAPNYEVVVKVRRMKVQA